MNYITKQSVIAHAQGLINCPLHNFLAESLEQLLLKGLTNIVKIQEVIARRTKSNSILHKENQNIKGFSPHNHFELTQRILNLKFVSKINLNSLQFCYSF